MRDTEAGRHVSNAVAAQILRFVAERAGDDGLEALLVGAGDQRSLDELRDLTGWSSWHQARMLLETAATILGGTSALREVVHHWVRADASGEVVSLLQSLGSPAAVLTAIAETAAKLSPVVRMRAADVQSDRAVITAEEAPGFPRYAALCDYTAGLLSIPPMLFGLAPAEVSETSCTRHGDPECTYVLRWDESTATADRTVAFLRAELGAMTQRFDAFKATASELLSGNDLELLLRKITGRAATAVRAPGYVLAVRPHPGGELRVHHSGVPDADVPALVESLLRAEPDDRGGSLLAVDVASGERHYGRLAAVFPDGGRFFPAERSLLQSYAGLAAAALDAATALDTATREAATANALLELAAALGEVRSSQEMAQRLVDAVPGVVACDVAAVYLFEEEPPLLRLTATRGLDRELQTRVATFAITLDDTPLVEKLVETQEPHFIDASTTDDFLRRVLDVAGVRVSVVVPLVRHGRFYGVLAVGNREPTSLSADDDLLARLRGLADHAAAALQNAELLERVRHQALHDGLTGLPNRALLEDRVAQALRHAKRRGGGASILFVDLDRLKVVNDTLGHGAGDRVICQVGERLRRCLRESDTLARLGGDEFAVLLPETGSVTDAVTTAEKMLAAMAMPFRAGGTDLFVTCSIGLAVFPEHGSDYEALLSHADAAMYEAKASGRNTWRVAATEQASTRRVLLDLETALHRAVGGDELFVVYQPQVALDTMRVVGVEALVRWRHPSLGVLSAGQFLPVAEESGLIVEIDRSMRERAFADVAAWRREGSAHLRLAVNVSARELRNPKLVAELEQSLSRHGIPPGDVEVEITDRVAVEDGHLAAVTGELKALGVRVAIDDFGTGTSVLTRLNQVGIDTLKLDRRFVQEITSDADGAPIVLSLVTLAQSLEICLVAEGVETSTQVGVLRRLGCEMAQGFFFGAPMPASGARRLSHAPIAGVSPAR